MSQSGEFPSCSPIPNFNFCAGKQVPFGKVLASVQDSGWNYLTVSIVKLLLDYHFHQLAFIKWIGKFIVRKGAFQIKPTYGVYTLCTVGCVYLVSFVWSLNYERSSKDGIWVSSVVQLWHLIRAYFTAMVGTVRLFSPLTVGKLDNQRYLHFRTEY